MGPEPQVPEAVERTAGAEPSAIVFFQWKKNLGQWDASSGLTKKGITICGINLE